VGVGTEYFIHLHISREFGTCQSGLVEVGVGEDHDDFVQAEPVTGIGQAQMKSEFHGKVSKYGLTCHMSGFSVYLFQVLHREDNQRERDLVAL